MMQFLTNHYKSSFRRDTTSINSILNHLFQLVSNELGEKRIERRMLFSDKHRDKGLKSVDDILL